MKLKVDVCWLDGRGELIKCIGMHYNADWSMLVFYAKNGEELHIPVANLRWFKIRSKRD